MGAMHWGYEIDTHLNPKPRPTLAHSSLKLASSKNVRYLHKLREFCYFLCYTCYSCCVFYCYFNISITLRVFFRKEY